MYRAHARRKATERCLRVKEAMIAGVWGNPNYDSQEKGKAGAREGFLSEIEEKFAVAIDEIWGRVPKDEGMGMDSPFFKAMRVPDIDHGPGAKEIEERIDREADDDPATWDQM